MFLVVHPHFHGRYTGATRHVETVVPALNLLVETKVMGSGVDGALPRISWRELWVAARSQQVIWHAHRVNELFVGLLLRLLGRRVRVVFTRHSVGRPSWLTRFLAARADARVVLTKEVEKDFGLPAALVGHGVDLERFHPPADRAHSWRVLAQGGTRALGVVSRVRPDKGQGDFVEALAPLLHAHPEWRGVLIGLVKSTEEPWVRGLRERGGPSCLWVGEQRNVEAWYQGLSIVVSPSHEESFGLARAEALASGCCLVTTRLNAFDASLEHGRTAFLYEKGDVASLRAILEELLQNPAKAEEVGRRGAEFARAQLSIQQEALGLWELYRTLE